MRKLIFILIIGLFFDQNAFALNLARVKEWVDAEVLTASDLNAEFDNIVNHSLTNDDISASAAIVGSKLNLAVPPAIGGTTPNTGAFSTLSATSTITAGTVSQPDAADGATLGTASLEWSDLYLADGAVIYFGSDQDVILTHVADTGIQLAVADRLLFGDTAVYVSSEDDGHLDLEADISIDINGPWTAAGQTCTDLGIVTTVDINGGTIDGATIGGAAAGAGTFTSVTTAGITASSDLDIGTYELRANTFESDVATGTAPFTIASTTKSTNLNADLLDGYNSSTTAAATTIYVSDANGFIPGQFGAWASKEINTVYQAATDGFVLAYIDPYSTGNFDLKGITDANASPSTVRCWVSGGSSNYGTLTFPVRKGDYWTVTVGTVDASVVNWLPIGN